MPDDSNQKDRSINLEGPHRANLDAKKRLRVPKDFLSAFPPGAVKTLIVFKAKDHCLTLYTTEEWENIKAEVAARPPSAERREIQRYMSLASRSLGVDGRMRVLIPPEFHEMIDNAKELVVVFVGMHMEIWNAADYGEMFNNAWETYKKSNFERG